MSGIAPERSNRDQMFIEEFYPDVTVRDTPGCHTPLFDLSKAESLLGWELQRVWRGS